jgi:uncharacterized protein YjbI with pentapeptide repeats
MMLDMVLAGDLSDAERRVWDAFPTGRLVDFGTGNADDDDPAGGESWGPDRQVHAEVLVALLCGVMEAEPGRAGEIWLDRARIIGMLSLPGATFKHRLRLTKCYLPDGIDLSEATTRTLDLEGCRFGEIHLYRAKINGTFILSGAHLTRKDGRALTARGLTVTGDMNCGGFWADGEISLVGASIGGQLDLSGAHLDGKKGPALSAQMLTVTENMFCDEGFRADGAVSLAGASIGGQLVLSGAHLNGKKGPALSAQRLTVTQDMFCNKGFRADGAVILAGGNIGNLSLSGAHLDGKKGPALIAQDLTVTQAMFCVGQFRADGEISLIGASIGGQLVLSGAHLNSKEGFALRAEELTVTGDMFCNKGFRADGGVILTRAKIGALIDDRGSWPRPLDLDGLIYGDLTNMPARERLDWLKRSVVGYSPQPYEQLAGYYRRLGNDEQARRVLLAKQRQRRRQRLWWTRWWGWLQDALVGYGYAPGRALLWLAGAFVAGWLVFRARPPAPAGAGPHPDFNAALYTLDVLIPAPALGQASDWDPRGVGLAVATGLHILGWLLAITVIAAITRSFSRT